MPAQTIDEVIAILEQIIETSKAQESTLGYFAALYQKVTIHVKEKLGTGYFDDDKRMEQLDVVFANRYLEAYFDYTQGKSTTRSWKTTFDATGDNSLIVLQHLLLGMNAHINLDLGIAVSELTTKSTIDDLHSDFNKINDILNSLVEEVQNDLAKIWPTLLAILKFFNKVDDFLIRFSMIAARDGAWKFANGLVKTQPDKRENLILARDQKIADIARIITPRGIIERIIFKIIRLGEKGSPSDKIDALKEVMERNSQV